jgi:hypothetical protein
MVSGFSAILASLCTMGDVSGIAQRVDGLRSSKHLGRTPMAAGYDLDQTGDVGYFEDITLGPDEEAQWWFSWDFDERHWQRMSFVPVGRGIVTIASEWVERDVSQDKWGTHDTVVLWVRLRNDSGEVITVRPTVFVAPTRYRR